MNEWGGVIGLITPPNKECHECPCQHCCVVVAGASRVSHRSGRGHRIIVIHTPQFQLGWQLIPGHRESLHPTPARILSYWQASQTTVDIYFFV